MGTFVKRDQPQEDRISQQPCLQNHHGFSSGHQCQLQQSGSPPTAREDFHRGRRSNDILEISGPGRRTSRTRADEAGKADQD